MNCKCYHLYTGWNGVEVGECWGTREKDECFCDGYEEKCTFYPEKREKALKELQSLLTK